MAADEFRLVIANPTGFRWEADALRDVVVASRAGVEVPRAREGSKFPLVLHVPEDGGMLKLQLHESGQLLSFDYGSPELCANVIELILNAFPPPDDAEILLFEWGDNPRVTAATTAQDLLATGP